MPTDYYPECQIACAGSIEIGVSDHTTVIVSATRHLPADADLAAIVDDGVLQVLCTLFGREPVVMGEFTDWTSYTVRRSARRGRCRGVVGNLASRWECRSLSGTRCVATQCRSRGETGRVRGTYR